MDAGLGAGKESMELASVSVSVGVNTHLLGVGRAGHGPLN